VIRQNQNNGSDDGGGLPGGPEHVGIMPESLIRIIWRGRWLVLLATVVTVSAAIVYLIKATPIYTSTSRIYVEQSGPKIFSETETGVMTQSKNYLYTQSELLTSTPIIAAVLDVPGIAQMKTLATVDNATAYLKKKLDAGVGKKDDIISLSFKSPYPAEAAQMVNEIVDSYITYQATSKRSTSTEVLKILQTEKAERSKDLTAKLTAMMDFKKQNESLAFEGSRGNIVIARLERLSEVLTEAQLATIEAKSTYESVEGMVSDPARLKQFVEAQRAKGVYVSTSSEKAALRSKLDELELRRADRRRQVKSGHPAVMALEVEIANVETQIADLDAQFARAQLAVAEQEYISAKDREDQLALFDQEQRKLARDLSEQLDQYTILQSEWDQTRKLCDILDDRIKELNVTEDVGALNISILEVARAADKPSEPRKARVMAMALMMGLMLGGGMSLARDLMDQRLRSAEEISAVLGLPILGVVPSMPKKLGITDRGQRVHKDSDSPVAEAYRTIRTAVFFGAPKDEARTILVTSPAPGDGKSTLTSNLAIAMAQAGRKVLILDADFRKPMQHRIFNVNHNNVGLSNIIAGITASGEAIRPTEVEGLELLPCGRSVPNPSEMLNSDSFAQLLEILSDRYDRLIIDAPPIMPVTDAQILAAICDITLLVLRADKSTRKTSQQARDGLLSVGANILGALVNDVPKRGRYGYYSGYGYKDSHGYGRSSKRKAGDREPMARTVESDRFAGSDA